MKHDVYALKDFTEIKNRINKEILRRGTFKWWGPLTTPTVGTDKSSPLSLPDIGQQVLVDERAFTINNNSEGSISPTHNIEYPKNAENPGGENYEEFQQAPFTSAAHFRVDELRNFLVGLATIHDIEMFYGRDEKAGAPYRDYQPIVDVLESAESDKLHELADDVVKVDPNRGLKDRKHDMWPNIRALIGATMIDSYLYLLYDDKYDEPNLTVENGCLILTYSTPPDPIENQLIKIRFMIEGDELFFLYSGLSYDYIEDSWFPHDDMLPQLENENLVELYDSDYDDPSGEIGEDGNLYMHEPVKWDPVDTDFSKQAFSYDNVTGDLYVDIELPPPQEDFKEYLLRYPQVDGYAVMPSGEYDGEEIYKYGRNVQYHVNDSNSRIVVNTKMEDTKLNLYVDEPYENPDVEINSDGDLIIEQDTVFPDTVEKQLLSTSYTITDGNLIWNVEGLGIKELPQQYFQGEGLGPHNFFDDYGAEPGDGDFHPVNKAKSPIVSRDFVYQDDQRHLIREHRVYGNKSSSEYGPNPRNPVKGNPYEPRPVFKGTLGTCQTMCTGLCYVTCDDFCSESCSSTCWNRCGTACSSGCTGGCANTCSSQCYTTCKTKCENSTGYACLKAGAKTVKIETIGGKNGEPEKVTLESTTYTCNQTCSYSCQYYPNKKTTCWDAGCMGSCFVTCYTGCATTCMGSCMNNAPEGSNDYKSGKGQGCSSSCTVNCVGTCARTCSESCTIACYHQCVSQCNDNCTFTCETECGHGCTNTCVNWCEGGCSHSCETGCISASENKACAGCSTVGGCMALCEKDCNANCVNNGCRAMCGSGPENACSANCRINCMSSSCTAMCSDQCNNLCTTCVNTCGFQCGACGSSCSADCTETCAIYCSEKCQNSCESNCVHSCSEDCGGCSSLCYSCVSMCIGVCSVHCENGCSHCANQCSWWCDNQCSQHCTASCDDYCLSTCTGSCISYSTAETFIPLTPEAKEREEEGWPDPNAPVRVITEGPDLVQEVDGEELEFSDMNINVDGDLILNSTGSEVDEEMEEAVFQIEEDQTLSMTVEYYTRGDQQDEMLLIPEWSESNDK